MTKEEWEQALSKRVGEPLRRTFAEATVAVCGLGGLGSHIAPSLARAGVGRLVLIDFDRVDLSNLHRQAYFPSQIGENKTDALLMEEQDHVAGENVLAAAPYVCVRTHCLRLTAQNAAELLEDADVVCEAFDDPQAKAMLVDAAASFFPEKWLVAASGMAGIGSPNRICTRKLAKRMFLCGDGTSDAADGIGLAAPRVMLCAAHQALTVLRILAGETDV